MPTRSADHRAADDAANIPYIKQIVLQNFMCHENFKLLLGPSMNVIVGTNGSGKSSILTGIMIALGGRARTTSRGDSLSGLVQTGKARAIVSLKLHIPVEYRQMYQKYGNEVSITRIINASGASGKGSSQYKLKDSQGREVKGSRAKEVQAICQHFGLYPDNELAMLSQENAKEFLVSATPQTKYEKLKRALLLNVIEHDSALVKSHEQEHAALIDRIDIIEKSAKEKQEKADETLDRAKAHASASAQLKAIKLILAWRSAKEVMTRVQESEQKLSTQDSQLQMLEADLDIDSRRRELEVEQQHLTERRTRLIDHLSELEAENDRLAHAVSRSQINYERTEAEVKELKKQATNYEQQIVDSERAAAELTPEVVAHRRAEVDRAMQAASMQRTKALATKRNEDLQLAGVQESINESEGQLKDLKLLAEEAEEQVRVLKQELQNVQKGNSAKSSIPGEIHRLKQLIDRTRWIHKPVGPLYQFVQMKDNGADFAPALERIWSNTLEGWWVETEEDRKQLQRLAEECRIKSLRIFKRRDDPFDFSSALPRKSKEYIRAIDVVDTASDAILRILVDLNHVETLVLVENIDTALELTDNRIPGNPVKRALSMTAESGKRRKFMNVTSQVGRTESTSVEPMNQPRMKVGAEARTRQLNAELQEKEEELLSVREQVNQEEKSLIELKKKLRDHLSARKKAEDAYTDTEKCEDDLRKKLMDLETQVKSFDISEELEYTHSKLRELRTQIQEGDEALQEQRDELEESSKEKETLKHDKSAVNDELKSVDKRLRQVIHSIHKVESDFRHKTNKHERELLKREQLAAELRALQVERDEVVGAAESLGSNPYDTIEQDTASDQGSSDTQTLLEESKFALESRLNNLRGQQQAISAAEDDIREAQKLKEDAIRECQKLQHNKDEILRLGEEIKQRQRKRDDNEARSWNAIKQHIRSIFAQTLERRSFVGTVDIDDEKSKLITHATPGEASNRSTSTLSGGEKSFTQVALLLAVWSAMHVGFVAMDEYDVYMDKVNRSLSLQLLAQVVAKKDIQCILITPQDVDARALEGMHCKIHKLAAARP